MAKKGNLIDKIASELILIPEGDYKARFIDHECGVFFGRQPKLMAVFEIQEGDHQGVMLARYYNVKFSRGGLTKQRWKVGRSSDLLREFSDSTMLSYKRLDQLPMTDWRERCDYVKASVKTVKTTSHQKELSEAAQYSVIHQVNRWSDYFPLRDNEVFIQTALRTHAQIEEMRSYTYP